MERPREPSPIDAAASPPGHLQHLGKALASAGLFGGLGAWLGHLSGKLGADPKHNMAAPVMAWGMGVFSAVLAAYSSFKASERVDQQNEDAARKTTPSGDAAELLKVKELKDPNKPMPVPLSAIHGASAETHGQLATAMPQQQR